MLSSSNTSDDPQQPTIEMSNEATFHKDILKAQSFLDSHDWDDANEIYSTILEEQVPILGQFAPLLGPVYLGYGKALFQMGLKKQDDIINETAMPSSILEGLLSAQQQEAFEQPDSKKRKYIDLDNVTLEEQVQASNGDDDDDDDDEKGFATEDCKDHQDSNSTGKLNEEDEEQMDDMELAWDILDLARLVYVDTADKKESKIALSEIHSILGDISMETENFKQAADDFFNACQYHKDAQVDNERLLASLFYREGIALEYDGRPEESKTPLNSAKDILSALLDVVGSEENSKDDPEGKDAAVCDSSSSLLMEELTAFIKDIDNKLLDISNGTTNGATIGNASLKSSMMAAATNAAQDLTSMIKKRKA